MVILTLFLYLMQIFFLHIEIIPDQKTVRVVLVGVVALEEVDLVKNQEGWEVVVALVKVVEALEVVVVVWAGKISFDDFLVSIYNEIGNGIRMHASFAR